MEASLVTGVNAYCLEFGLSTLRDISRQMSSNFASFSCILRCKKHQIWNNETIPLTIAGVTEVQNFPRRR